MGPPHFGLWPPSLQYPGYAFVLRFYLFHEEAARGVISPGKYIALWSQRGKDKEEETAKSLVALVLDN